MTTLSISNQTPLTPFNVKSTPSVLQKPNSCTNGQKNNLQKDILNHLNSHMLQVPFASKIKMACTDLYKTTGQSITGRSKTSIHFQISNTSRKNFKDTPCSLNLTSDSGTIMYAFARGTNGKLPFELWKDTGNPKSCTLDSVMCHPPSKESSINSYNH